MKMNIIEGHSPFSSTFASFFFYFHFATYLPHLMNFSYPIICKVSKNRFWKIEFWWIMELWASAIEEQNKTNKQKIANLKFQLKVKISFKPKPPILYFYFYKKPDSASVRESSGLPVLPMLTSWIKSLTNITQSLKSSFWQLT